MIKLIASDMDGTLLDSNRNIDEKFYEILEDLKTEKILFVAISGREIGSLSSLFKENIRKNIIFAPNNGNLVIYKNEVLFENYINKEKLIKIAPLIRKYANNNTIYCAKKKVYSENLEMKIASKAWNTDVDVVNNITKINDHIMKISIFANEDIINKILEESKNLDCEFNISMSGPNSLDICEIGGNKKQAINIIQEKFNISYDETMVFGDHMNDLEMMESAYYSFAMGNAMDKVKLNARFITKTNDENGVLEAIKEVALDKKYLVKNQ